MGGRGGEGVLVGHAGDLSILADRSQIGAEDAAFELYDGRRGLAYWVRAIPTPRVARVLLERHGGPPEEERGLTGEW